MDGLKVFPQPLESSRIPFREAFPHRFSNMIRTYTTKRGVRMKQHGTVLSEVLREPGPTHSVADVLAVLLDEVRPEGTVAILGFAGGGIMAPLRALRADHRVTALDLDTHGFSIFARHCQSWAGSLRLLHAEAGQWLRRGKSRFDAIVVDLSVSLNGDVQTPRCVWTDLPGLVARRLKPDGLVIFNVLRPLEMRWEEGLQRLTEPFSAAWKIEFEEYENRVVLAGKRKATARQLAAQARRKLRWLGSKQAGRITASTLPSSRG